MIIRLYYKGKTEKIDISNPLTYEKVTSAIEEKFGLIADKQLLIVNNTEVTPDADFRRLKVHLYPIEVRELKNLSVSIGKLSFPLSFYFGFKCSVLCAHILDVLKSNAFEIPNIDYFLEIDGKAVDINATLENIGAVENSSVAVYSNTGNLSDYFYLDDEYSADPSMPLTPEEKEVPQPAQQEAIPPVHEEVQLIQQENAQLEEENAQPEALEDELVTVHRRQPKDNKTKSNTQPKPTSLPKNILSLLATIRQALPNQEEPLSAVAEIEKVLLKCQDRLFDAGMQLQQYEDTMTDIHYENQMLREMYKTVNPSTELEKEMEMQKNSWKRVSMGDESLESLPDEVDELKKLVHEKYAVALMNERRFEKERKRCKKWKLAAQTLGMNEENIDEFYSEYHGIVEHRDQLKEQNLDLREQLRKINSEIDARDDELRRLTETIQCRDATIAELAERLQNGEGNEKQVKMEESRELIEEMEKLQKQNEELQELMEQMENMKGVNAEEGEKKLELVQKQLEMTQIENANLKKTLDQMKGEKKQSEEEEKEVVENLQSIVEMINSVIAKKNVRKE